MNGTAKLKKKKIAARILAKCAKIGLETSIFVIFSSLVH